MAVFAAMLASSMRAPSDSSSLQIPSPCKCICWEQSNGAAVGTGLTVMLSLGPCQGLCPSYRSAGILHDLVLALVLAPYGGLRPLYHQAPACRHGHSYCCSTCVPRDTSRGYTGPGKSHHPQTWGTLHLCLQGRAPCHGPPG